MYIIRQNQEKWRTYIKLHQLQNSLFVKRLTKVNYGLRLRRYITADKMQDIYTYDTNYWKRVSYEVADDNKFSGKTRINIGSLSAKASAKTKTKTGPKPHYGWQKWERNNVMYSSQVLDHGIYFLALEAKFCNHWEKATNICTGNVQHTGTEADNFGCKNTKQVTSVCPSALHTL